MATSSDTSLREGNRSVEVNEKTVQFPGGKDANYRRTLAAAYAEVGQFSEAIATAEQATQLATVQGKPTLATIIEKGISLYRAHIAVARIGRRKLRALAVVASLLASRLMDVLRAF